MTIRMITFRSLLIPSALSWFALLAGCSNAQPQPPRPNLGFPEFGEPDLGSLDVFQFEIRSEGIRPRIVRIMFSNFDGPIMGYRTDTSPVEFDTRLSGEEAVNLRNRLVAFDWQALERTVGAAGTNLVDPDLPEVRIRVRYVPDHPNYWEGRIAYSRSPELQDLLTEIGLGLD